MDQELELRFWREAGAQPTLAEALPTLLELLCEALPASGLQVRHLDAERRRTEVRAWTGDVPARLRVTLTSEDDTMAESLAVLRRGQVVAGLLSAMAPLGVVRDARPEAAVIPCSADTGVVVLARRPLADTELQALASLTGPLGALIAHDERLRELQRMRDAAEADNQALLSRLRRQAVVDSIVGADGGLREVMVHVDRVATTDAPVLLLGETGSGKEVIARAIHDRSRRHEGPIVRVNCGAIPSQLVDSALFGHERGSFTGATEARRGWFERAHGGTLMLDEVGELPLEAQVRLLRVLQEGTIERVGGQRPLTVDVRIVAATHRDLLGMVREGRFREDLWYRISVFPLRIPSLRERREDLPALAAFFAAQAGERLGGAPLALDAQDLDLLLGYHWPGNVRELAAVIERAVILGQGKRVELAAAIGAGDTRPSKLGSSAGPVDGAEDGRLPTLDEVVVQHVERVLARTGGRIEGRGGAADVLGVNPHTLRARMRKLGVDWSRWRAQSGSASPRL